MNYTGTGFELLLSSYKAKRAFFVTQLQAIQDRPHPDFLRRLSVSIALCDYCLEVHASFAAAAVQSMRQIPSLPEDIPLLRQLVEHKNLMSRILPTIEEPLRSKFEEESQNNIDGLEAAIQGHLVFYEIVKGMASLAWANTDSILIQQVFSSEDKKYSIDAVNEFSKWVYSIFKIPLGPLGEWLETAIEGKKLITDILGARAQDALTANEQYNRIDDFAQIAILWCCITKVMTVHLPNLGTPVQYGIKDAYVEFLPDFQKFAESKAS